MTYNGTGAYFSGSGAPIRQGAAGIGEYFGGDNAAESAPPVFAFQDGVLGAPNGSSDGPLMAYKDGSLGMPLHIDGKLIRRPVTIHHGPMSGALPRGALRAYRDGVLGATEPGTKIVNLRDPASLKEVKAAMALAAPSLALADPSVTGSEKTGGGYFDEAFYDSPIWGLKASELWSAVSANILKLPDAPYKESDVTREKDGNVYPTATGLFVTIALAYPPTGTQPQSPILLRWAQTVMDSATSPTLEGFEVSEPFFTEGERIKGKGGGFSYAGISGKGWLAAAAVATVVGAGAYFVIKK